MFVCHVFIPSNLSRLLQQIFVRIRHFFKRAARHGVIWLAHVGLGDVRRHAVNREKLATKKPVRLARAQMTLLADWPSRGGSPYRAIFLETEIDSLPATPLSVMPRHSRITRPPR